MAHQGRENADSVLAALLAAGHTVRDAARQAGVSEKTGYRRTRDPKFRRRVARLRSGMIAAAAGKLATSMGAASDALTALLTDADSAVKLRAASKVIELGIKVTEYADLEQRVKELEKLALAKGVN